MDGSPLSALLAESGVILLDGAQGTELERRGVDLAGSKLWSAQLLIDDPDLVRAIHLDYLRAGSDVITTFTYQASLQGFADAGVSSDAAAALLNRAVDLAETARATFLEEQQPQQLQEQQPQGQQQGSPQEGQQEASGPQRADGAATRRRARPLVAFSSGSYGAFLADGSEFRGDYAETVSLQQLADFHRARLEPVRHRTEIDLLAFETVPCLKEAEAIVRLLREERYGKPAWISFSCRDAVHTCHGERFAEQCVPLLAAAAAEGLVVAAGVNCTAPRHVGPLLMAAREQLAAGSCRRDGSAGGGDNGGGGSSHAAAPLAPPPPQPGLQPQAHAEAQTVVHGVQQPQQQPQQLQLLCYPNSGEEWDGEHRCWRHLPDDIAEPGRFAEEAAEWVRGAARVTLVGGCCRTGPQHISAVRRRLMQPVAAPAASAAVAANTAA